jgi:hypothetical protein
VAPSISPTQARPCADCKHIVFVPVSGQLVFAVCVLLALAIFFLWFLPLCRKGKKFNEES